MFRPYCRHARCGLRGYYENNPRTHRVNQKYKGDNRFMRAIYSGGIKAKILFTLRNYGDTKRASFVNRLSEHHRQSVDRALTGLLRDGYVEQYKKAPQPRQRPVRYLTLSDKGKQAIKQLEQEHGENPPNQAHKPCSHPIHWATDIHSWPQTSDLLSSKS